MQLSDACSIASPDAGMAGSGVPGMAGWPEHALRHGRMMLDQIGDFLRLQRERLVQWWDPDSATDQPPGQPLFFLHIAKTGISPRPAAPA
jgi:hypothetical protein